MNELLVSYDSLGCFELHSCAELDPSVLELVSGGNNYTCVNLDLCTRDVGCNNIYCP